jgi:hypothetical protein
VTSGVTTQIRLEISGGVQPQVTLHLADRSTVKAPTHGEF